MTKCALHSARVLIHSLRGRQFGPHAHHRDAGKQGFKFPSPHDPKISSSVTRVTGSENNAKRSMGGDNQESQEMTHQYTRKQREGTTAPPKAHAPPDPGTTHIHLHTEPPQQPIDEPQRQRTQPNTTTMETQRLTPTDTDDNTTEENTAALRDLRITPEPPNWPQMTKKQRRTPAYK